MDKESNVLNSPQFNSPFISSYKTSDIELSNTKRLIRYHYVSASTLQKILDLSDNEPPTLRFTDIRFMNDHSEMVCCVKALLDYLDDKKKDYPFCWDVVNTLLLKEHSPEEYITLSLRRVEFSEASQLFYSPTRCFAFCMSESDDLLNMWNYYLHNDKYEGYNIGFNVYKFLKSFDTEGKNSSDPVFIHYGKVLYTKDKQEREIKHIVEIIENSRRKHPTLSGDPYSVLMKNVIYLRHYIESFGAFFKDESFKA